jgi:hypothetical protein
MCALPQIFFGALNHRHRRAECDIHIKETSGGYK